MDIRTFENHLRTLIELDECEAPLISYYLDLRDPEAERVLRGRAAEARKAIEPARRAAFERAIDRIEDHVPWKLEDSTRSVAVFARAGENPLFLVLELQAALEPRLFVDTLPVIFPLVEVKDNFHRYVLMICNEESARVLEVSLGAVTREVWTRRPELRKRVGREWTRLHYRNHRRDRGDRFVKEKVALVERVVRGGGHTHLMLAGDPQALARVRKALPRALRDKLVDAVPAPARDRSTDVVLATLSTFLEHEERESLAAVGMLRHELLRGGLAVAGPRACREALEWGQADLLIVPAASEEEPARHEDLVRLAVRNGVPVEVVRNGDELERLGGVGCLLRFELWTPAAAAAHPAA